MKKLFTAVLLFAGIGAASRVMAAPMRYVQISSLTAISQQAGGFNVSTGTVSTMTITNQLTMSSKKIVSVATGTAHGDAAIYGQLKVLQVQQYTITGSTASIVNTFVPTSLTGTITPTSTSNKVLLMMTSRSANGTGAKSCTYTFLRNGSNILGAQGGSIHQDTDAATIFPISIVYLDSPGTTSSTTYTVGIMGDTGSTCTMGQTNLTSTLVLVEVNGI